MQRTEMMLMTGKMMMMMLSWTQFLPKVSYIREALQVLHDCMPFSLSGEDIQQKLNALSISIDGDVTAKMTQSDIRAFFQWCTVLQYILFNFQIE